MRAPLDPRPWAELTDVERHELVAAADAVRSWNRSRPTVSIDDLPDRTPRRTVRVDAEVQQ